MNNYVIKYDIKLIHWHCVGTNEDGPMYDGDEYEISYPFELTEKQIKEKLSDGYDVDWNKSMDEIFKEFYADLRDEFRDEAQAEAEDYQERGFL